MGLLYRAMRQGCGLAAGGPLWPGFVVGPQWLSTGRELVELFALLWEVLGLQAASVRVRVCGADAPQRTGHIRKTSKRVRIARWHSIGLWCILHSQAIGS